MALPLRFPGSNRAKAAFNAPVRSSCRGVVVSSALSAASSSARWAFNAPNAGIAIHARGVVVFAPTLRLIIDSSKSTQRRNGPNPCADGLLR
jgi:hypothetical protein